MYENGAWEIMVPDQKLWQTSIELRKPVSTSRQ